MWQMSNGKQRVEQGEPTWMDLEGVLSLVSRGCFQGEDQWPGDRSGREICTVHPYIPSPASPKGMC